MAPRLRRPKPRTVLAVVAVVAVAVVGATAAVAATSSGGHAYRTAVVRTGSVTRHLPGSGTVQAVTQASVAFPIAGTVTAVAVAPGAHVTAGQTLATLDASALEQTVIQKQAGLAAAQLTLYKALHGQATTTGGSHATANTASARTSTPAATSSTSAPQLQVVDAQQKVDAALAAVQTALTAADGSCGSSAPTPTPTTSRSPGAAGGSHGPHATLSTSSTSTTTVPAATPAPAAGFGSAACIAAQQQLLSTQQDLASAQRSLADAEQAFERALSTASSAGSAPPSVSTGGGTAPTASVSAAQLVADQAAVDAAASDLLAAHASLAQATVTSPIAGTVAAVSMRVGDHVDASSTTASVVVIGSGGWEIATSVGVADVVKLAVGDAATVTPDGSGRALTGKVVWIGAASGTTSTTYPVVIGLTGDASATAGAGLRSGALATTSIEIAHTAVAALTVPTSAVHTANGFHLVTVLSGAKTSSVAVRVGVVGAEATEITSGLRAGQVVVLADLHEAVPSSNTNSRIVNAITGGRTGGGALTRGFGG